MSKSLRDAEETPIPLVFFVPTFLGSAISYTWKSLIILLIWMAFFRRDGLGYWESIFSELTIDALTGVSVAVFSFLTLWVKDRFIKLKAKDLWLAKFDNRAVVILIIFLVFYP